MAIGRLSLELPAGKTAAEAEREAARALEASGVTGLSADMKNCP
jgi:hypothetical protein